jgi:magnesium-dependent phosphatase 1
MAILEIVPGVTLLSAFLTIGGGFGDERNLQIGRSAPLSSNKSRTHFPILREGTGIAFDEMLFFDDCNWTDHCKEVAKRCGVVTQRTPAGMTEEEWEEGLAKFAASKE